QRHDQVVEGQLKFASFRQALLKAKTDEITVDIGAPDAPYRRDTLPHSWDRYCQNGVVHHTATVEPKELPSRAIRLAMGYRTAELALILSPLPLTLLLALAMLIRLYRAAASAQAMDARALGMAYARAVARGLTALYLLWAAVWAAIAGGFGSEEDVWALF